MNRIALILLALLLQACGTGYSSKFMCKPGEGMGCTSMSSINEMVDNGTLHDTKSPKRIKLFNRKAKPAPIISDEYEHMRTKEKVLRVWINSYLDNDVYSGEKYIYMVLKNAGWRHDR